MTMWLNRYNGKSVPASWVQVEPLYSTLPGSKRNPGLIYVRDPERGVYPVEAHHLRTSKPH